jgi:agmatinase
MTTDNISRNTPDRTDLPFVGLTTFARQPACPDWDKPDGADVAILGIPIDTASSYRVGTRFGPRAIREASMFHAFGPDGVFDFEDEVTYLTANEVKIVDAGDSDVIYADTKRSLANAEQAVRALLEAKTLPYILGGDHAITMATIAAFSNEKPIHIVHLDAHFDFIDERNGISWGHGSPMRRASEMAHVKGITTLGPHNMASVSRKDWEAAKAYGTHVIPLRKARAQGAAASLAHIPDGERVYVSIDIDSFDPAIISWRYRRLMIPRASPPCSPHGPASISSVQSSTNAQSGAPDIDRRAGPPQGFGQRDDQHSEYSIQTYAGSVNTRWK